MALKALGQMCQLQHLFNVTLTLQPPAGTAVLHKDEHHTTQNKLIVLYPNNLPEHIWTHISSLTFLTIERRLFLPRSTVENTVPGYLASCYARGMVTYCRSFLALEWRRNNAYNALTV